MQIDSVPGLTIHEHEGHLAGTFELPSADLAAIRFDGRVMLAVIVDVGAPFRVTTTKDGTHLAHWTFKAVDAAIVRDEEMRRRIAGALHMVDVESVDPHPLDSDTRPPRLELEGVYDDEGTWMGMKGPDDGDGAWSIQGEDALTSPTVTDVEPDEIETFFEEEALANDFIGNPDGAPLFRGTPGVKASLGTVLTPAGGSKDPALERFLYDG